MPRPRQRVLGPLDSRAPLRRTSHGLTPAEQAALLVAQGGACAICGRLGERLQLDHDHRCHPGKTGCRRCVRGALCPRCNTALGRFGDRLIPRLNAYLSR
jgi:hypothetical protein